MVLEMTVVWVVYWEMAGKMADLLEAGAGETAEIERTQNMEAGEEAEAAATSSPVRYNRKGVENPFFLSSRPANAKASVQRNSR